MQSKIDLLETETKALRAASSEGSKETAAKTDRAAADTAKFDLEIRRLTSERNRAMTEMNVCKNDLIRMAETVKMMRETFVSPGKKSPGWQFNRLWVFSCSCGSASNSSRGKLSSFLIRQRTNIGLNMPNKHGSICILNLNPIFAKTRLCTYQ